MTDFKKEIKDILKKYWSFDHFRPLQEDIILSVLDKKDTLALLPTGGGKSICFQVPGLVNGGTTLVVSPLIALMNDQVSNLRKRGLSAVAISASMSFREIDIALNNAALGHVQFLYVSPERLQNEDFVEKLGYLPITLVAVDEAHCISQWGYDFRPSYLKIADLRTFFPGITIIALTASATLTVAADICDKLAFNNQNIIRQSFARDNLRYIVQLEENKGDRLLKLVSNIGGSGIVYVRNRKKTEELALFFKRHNISAFAYHAGLKFDERQTIQQSWIENKFQIITATNAFGMGIDKPDVRFVVHLDLPDSLEAYFQEAGRGGRDGKTAYSVVFYTKADHKVLQDQFEMAFPPIDAIRQSYQAICNYYQVAVGAGQGLNVFLDIERISKSYNLSPSLLYNSIRFLEKENYVSLLEGGFEPSKLMIRASKESIYEFELRHPKYEPLIKTLLRSYGGLFENYIFISERDLAYRTKSGVATIIEYLKYIEKQELISYIPQSSLPRLVFNQDRRQSKLLEFNPENYQRLKDNQLERIQSVINYTENNKVCRQVQLLLHFNEQSFTDCGYCDVCIGRKHSNLENIKTKLKETLEQQPLSLKQIKSSMIKYNDETWLKAFNELIDDGVVNENGLVYELKNKTKTD